jgi:hypothetical protein
MIPNPFDPPHQDSVEPKLTVRSHEELRERMEELVRGEA